MTRPGPGMDHDVYAYSALPGRPRLLWPGGAAVALNVVLHFDQWNLASAPGDLRDPRLRDPFVEVFPVMRMWSYHQYAHRVGIFRILDLLDELNVPVTLAANADALECYPYLTERFLKRGYEVAAHNVVATQMISSTMAETDERAVIERAIETVTRIAGTRPAGWVGQSYGESLRTPALLAEYGMRYLMDWPNDDQPYATLTDPAMVSLPIQTEWDPVQALWVRKLAAWRYPDITGEALAVLREEGAVSGRYFGMHIHPWLVGKPHIFPHFARALTAAIRSDGLWAATAGQVADHMASRR